MLKFKFTQRNNRLDNKSLEVTKAERVDGSIYEVYDGDLGTVKEINDKETYKFYVKDLYNLQHGSQLKTVNTVVVGNDEDNTRANYDYYKEFTVESVDTTNNVLTINVDKEFEFNISNIFIKTKYNVIYYYDNKWIITPSDCDTIKEQSEDFGNITYLPINSVAYGKNLVDIYSSYKEDYNSKVPSYTVFYYENDTWKSIDLERDNLEGCLENDEVSFSFNSFHLYDNRKLNAVKLEEGKLYYTRENYIVIETTPTHYFSDAIENYVSGDDGASTTTDYTRFKIESIDYPFIYLYIDYYDDIALSLTTIKVKKEVNIINNKQIAFNFDNFIHDFSNENDVVDENTEAIYPIVVSEEERITSLDDILEGNTKKTVYRRLSTKEISVIQDKLFPYGYGMTYVSNYCGTTDFGDFYDVKRQNAALGNITFKRDNFMFNGASYYLSFDSSVNVVQIPISQKFETDLYHNDALKTNYVDNSKENAINPIVDMEKDVYTPAISVSALPNDKQINSDYIDCFKIIFNLHFRKHRDTNSTNGTKQEWICDKNAYWNGTKENRDEEGNFISLNLRPNIDKNKAEEGFFSYYGSDDNICYQSYQSDLLSFLGFSNNDIKYQKSKLKKSFLRISFYDSENVGKQNLLCTSTIFLDSGKLFSKYIKHIDTVENGSGTYMAVIGGSNVASDTISYGHNGLAVNREPQREDTSDFDLADNVDEWEDMRLSSQFVVTDKYSSKHSSEGFYFYTYRTNDNGVYPSDIYMRVEFNHAGYGRTIPFMMPYVRESERKDEKSPYYGETKIKSFEDICNDWSTEFTKKTVDEDGKKTEKKYTQNGDDLGYGSVKYVKYTHIKWKYRYDKDTQKHIYYLDPELYGESVTSSNGQGNNIILNLYEGKIR